MVPAVQHSVQLLLLPSCSGLGSLGKGGRTSNVSTVRCAVRNASAHSPCQAAKTGKLPKPPHPTSPNLERGTATHPPPATTGPSSPVSMGKGSRGQMKSCVCSLTSHWVQFRYMRQLQIWSGGWYAALRGLFYSSRGSDNNHAQSAVDAQKNEAHSLPSHGRCS